MLKYMVGLFLSFALISDKNDILWMLRVNIIVMLR